jgi:hypothetical protein
MLWRRVSGAMIENQHCIADLLDEVANRTLRISKFVDRGTMRMNL